jgi:iron(III) transport system substrate-binding protein
VANGELKLGLTDTDDANGAIVDGKPAGIIYPDQGDGEIGVFVIPNTVAMIANCPHPENAKKLIDYILSKEIEEKLAFSRSAQIPVREGVKKPDNVLSLSEIKAMQVDFEAVADQMEATGTFLQDLFLR